MSLNSPRLLFATTCYFFGESGDLYVLKLRDLSKITFVGRSNFGKSSLINALFNQKNLLRTLQTSGRTQEINFFKLGDTALCGLGRRVVVFIVVVVAVLCAEQPFP